MNKKCNSLLGQDFNPLNDWSDQDLFFTPSTARATLTGFTSPWALVKPWKTWPRHQSFLAHCSFLTSTTSLTELLGFVSVHLVMSIRVSKYSLFHLAQNWSARYGPGLQRRRLYKTCTAKFLGSGSRGMVFIVNNMVGDKSWRSFTTCDIVMIGLELMILLASASNIASNS